MKKLYLLYALLIFVCCYGQSKVIFDKITLSNDSFTKEIISQSQINFVGSNPSEYVSVKITYIGSSRKKLTGNKKASFDKLINENMTMKAKENCSKAVLGLEYIKSEIDNKIKSTTNREVLVCYKKVIELSDAKTYLLQSQFYEGDFGFTITATSYEIENVSVNLRKIITQIFKLKLN